MATVVRENTGLLTDKLTVKINKEDYLPAFEKKVKEYSKTANIPGFRKGMVPAGMIKKMYGPGIFSDEVLRTVERELHTWLNTEKPEIFAQPLPLTNDIGGLDMNKPEDVSFDFEIGLKPVFEIPDLAKAPLTKHVVEVTDAMLDEEISRMQIKGGNMTEPEVIENEENVLNILFTETDAAGAPKETGAVKENSVILKYFTPAVQQKLMGMKVGDSIIEQLNVAFEGEKLHALGHDLGIDAHSTEAMSSYFKMEIVKIGLVEKRELDEAFFAEIFPGKEYKTLDEVKAALKTEMIAYWDAQSSNQLHDQLYHYLLEETKMEFPESFLKRWLQTGGEEAKTAEQAEAEFPSFSSQLKWTLISDRLITENKLEVGAEELRDSMKGEVMRYFGQMNMDGDLSWLDSYLDRMMKDEKQIEATYRRLITSKVFDFAAAQTNPAEKKVTADELVGMQHHHEH